VHGIKLQKPTVSAPQSKTALNRRLQSCVHAALLEPSRRKFASADIHSVPDNALDTSVQDVVCP